MEITAAQASAEGLVGYAEVAASLLTAGRHEELAHAFGYAIAYGRAPADAIRADLVACLDELGATCLASHTPSIEVSFFDPGSGLAAVAECRLPALPAGEVLLELVVTVLEGQHHVALEQISAVA